MVGGLQQDTTNLEASALAFIKQLPLKPTPRERESIKKRENPWDEEDAEGKEEPKKNQHG